jgi:hypothetical protein
MGGDVAAALIFGGHKMIYCKLEGLRNLCETNGGSPKLRPDKLLTWQLFVKELCEYG